MKRKAIFITLVVASLMTVFYACKKSFLDTLPTGSANDALLAYAAIDGQINGTDGAGWAASVTNWVWGDVASDDGTKGSDISDQSTIVPVENYSVDATNGYVADSWRFRYDGVARANAGTGRSHAQISIDVRELRHGHGEVWTRCAIHRDIWIHAAKHDTCDGIGERRKCLAESVQGHAGKPEIEFLA